MKKTTAVIIFLTLWHLSYLSNAAVLTVSNMASNPGQYSTILSAETAANNDDTLLIHGTGISYGNFTQTKRLVLIGAGNWQNTAFSDHYSFINTFRFDKSANGSKLIGLVFLSVECVGTINDTINNMLIEECYIGTILRNFSSTISNYIPWTNVIIRNCIFDRDSDNGTNNPDMSFILNFTTSNIRIENCIFDGYINGNGLIFNHCLFLKAGITGNIFQTVTNSLIENCMFLRTSTTASFFNTTNSINNTFNNNLTYRGDVVTLPYTGCNGSNNLNITNPLFVNALYTSFFNISSDYHLQPSSPAKNAATDGTDIGVYGGTNHFSTVLEPLMTPIIRQFTISNPTVSPGGTLNINVTATKPIDN